MVLDFIGSVIVEELAAVGHQVVGLAYSDVSAKILGVEVSHDAADSDGVIHCAFIHDFY